MFAIIILYFGLLNPVQSLLAKQKHEEKDWSMIMEVEVEDPIYNSSYDETDKKNIVNNKVNEPFQRKKNETITGIFTTQHSMPDATKCGSFLCFNHGRCYVDSNTSSAKCLCLLGYSGDLCDKVNDGHQFPYIQQGGYLKFNFKSSAPYIAANQSLTNYNHQMSINNTYTYRVDFEIQPNISDGSYLLVSHVSNDENFKFSLSIENGYVVYRSLRISRANYEPLSKEEIQEVKHFSFLNTEQWYYISFGEMIDGKSFLSVNGIKEDAVYTKISFYLELLCVLILLGFALSTFYFYEKRYATLI